MWVAVVVCLAVAVVGAVWLGFLPPPHAMILLKIRDGQVRVTKGRLPLLAKDHVVELLAEDQISQGWIAILADSRIACSRGIPIRLRQRLRNVLVNRNVD